MLYMYLPCIENISNISYRLFGYILSASPPQQTALVPQKTETLIHKLAWRY